ncbi:Sec63 [Steccherinum ochraceum]|uniref:DNA 3'-5' helicase n=1 Tax=Steccherinum ochraceum TaxID=92696 RepID=A0A4R0RFR5_9APHY|nr:Sec63 [Steccherinum ochraceum]
MDGYGYAEYGEYNDHFVRQDDDYIDDFEISPIRGESDLYEEQGHWTDEIENSSPSPPERVSVGFRIAPTSHAPSQPDSYEDHGDIENEDDGSPFAFNPRSTYSTARAGPSHQGQAQQHAASGSRVDQPRTQNTSFNCVQDSRSIQPTSRQPQSSRAPHSSQPVRTQTYGSRVEREDSSQPHVRGSDPRNAHGIRLRPTSQLPDIYRTLFKFGVFNAVQSECFDSLMYNDANMVVSAPTGSGKTVLFELAIIRMLMNSGSRPAKCIYVAPTKALCSEKYRDWESKFQTLGVKCCELTGDTVHFGRSAWGDAKDANIIVTTGEKWDSLTRNWEDHTQILSQIQLFLVDEVHILNESRGSTLEVVIARMRARGNSVRFVMVSATVPNIDDVANWTGHGISNGPAEVREFGEEFRPCKLSRFVYGHPRKQGANDFSFSHSLDFRLFAILQQHAANKPVLIFCPTRKGVSQTAEHLKGDYEKALNARNALPWTKPRRIEETFHDKKLDALVMYGIGIHHAGMTLDDRRRMETLFLNGSLRVIVATSTLAVGVNLPAHTVVVKGVKIYQNNTSQEYSDLDIMQMIGRAGRPQFDHEGVAIILCEQELESKYKALVQGRTFLESCLHLNLTEHINSEIGLHTITNVESAKDWLHKSFLFQRIQRNPRHYAIGKGQDQTWQERIDEMVTQSIDTLQQNELVQQADDGGLSSTLYGDIMSKYYVRQSTMGLILKISDKASLRDMMETLSTAEEYSDIRLRAGDKTVYNKLRQNSDIRFPVKKIEKSSDKVFLILQAVLGCVNLNDKEYKSPDCQPSLEALTIFRHAPRLARGRVSLSVSGVEADASSAMVEVALIKQCGAQIKHGLELLRCLHAKAWEDRATVLRQVEQVGEKSIKVLAEHGITSIASLRAQDTLRIEQLMNRKPPFGNELLAKLKNYPRYTLSVTEASVTPSDGQSPVEVELSIQCGLVQEGGFMPKKKPMRGGEWTVVFACNSDLDYIDFRRTPTKALKSEDGKTFSIVAELTKPSQSITVQISSEQIAGVAVSKTYKPKIPHSQFPTLDTRPKTSLQNDMDGLEEDPNFWENFEAVDGEDDVVDLTRSPADSQGQVMPSQALSQLHKPTVAAEDYIPRMRPDGKFECNHPCKDKTKCRHYCCHDGLEKPPPWTKKRLEKAMSKENSQTTLDANVHQIQDEDIRPKPKPKAKPKPKPDPGLEHLEHMHRSTHVRDHLSLPEGRRIKVEDNPSALSLSRFKMKAKPTFEPATIADLDDSDDASLPDIADLISGTASQKKKSSSSTNYSDPEMDSLIGKLPLDDLAPSASIVPAKARARSSSPDVELITLPPRKRVKFAHQDPSPIKPESKSAGFAKPFSQKAATSVKKYSSESQKMPLFFPDSPSPQSAPSPPRSFAPGPRDDEDFVLDTSLLNILPSSPASTALSSDKSGLASSSSSVAASVRPKLHESVFASTPAFNPRYTPPDEMMDEEEEMSGGNDDILAELEAFLESDAVIIVDKRQD